MKNEPLLRLRLARVPGLGPRGARRLELRLGLEGLFAAPPDPRLACLPQRIADALPGTEAIAREELRLGSSLGHRLLCLRAPRYPAALAELHDPPQALWVKGDLGPPGPAIAIVGARRATHEGRSIARELACELAREGITIVSGLARGIDQAAHQGALDAGGRTLAVLGQGLARRLPPPAAKLAAEIVAAHGAVISELPPRAEARRHTFPQRNRIVVGLSLGVVVVQAGPRSGALITADLALSEGRELMAVPGSTREPLSQGPNALIQDGAALVRNAADVLAACELSPALPSAAPGASEAALIDALRPGPSDLSELVHRSGLAAEEAMAALARLELAGQASVRLGGLWALT